MAELKKPKTQEQLDKATDARLRKTYGRSLAWYDETFIEQGEVCAICFQPPTTRRLHVDHDHRFRYTKVISIKSIAGFWDATAISPTGKRYYSCSVKKSLAIQSIRGFLKTDSVRGLICYRCNVGLEKFSDDPTKLTNAATYIKRFHE